MKKKRKSMFLYYPLIYSKLVLYFFSFYAFLFFGLLTELTIRKIPDIILKKAGSVTFLSNIPDRTAAGYRKSPNVR